MSAGAGRLPPPPTTAARPNQTVSERVFVPWAEGAATTRADPPNPESVPSRFLLCRSGSKAPRGAQRPPMRDVKEQAGIAFEPSSRLGRALRGTARSGFDPHFSSGRASVPAVQPLPGQWPQMCVLNTILSCRQEAGRLSPLAAEKRGRAILVGENEARSRQAAFRRAKQRPPKSQIRVLGRAASWCRNHFTRAQLGGRRFYQKCRLAKAWPEPFFR